MRYTWILLVAFAVVAAGQAPAWGDQPFLENNRSESNADLVDKQKSTFKSQFKEATLAMKTAVTMYVKTVFTVAKAVAKAIHTAIVAVARLLLQFVVKAALVLGHWLLSLLMAA